jgi:hypothetical protein
MPQHSTGWILQAIGDIPQSLLSLDLTSDMVVLQDVKAHVCELTRRQPRTRGQGIYCAHIIRRQTRTLKRFQHSKQLQELSELEHLGLVNVNYGPQKVKGWVCNLQVSVM